MNRQSSSWKILAILAIALVVCLAVIGFFIARENDPQRVKLADGRIVQLAGITSGSEHKLVPKGPRAILKQLAPVPLKKLFGVSFNASFGFSSDNGIALWLMCYDPVLDQYASAWVDKVVAIDEHGCEYQSTGTGATSDGYHAATLFHFPAFPRRQKEFTCRLIKHVNGKEQLLGKITIQNPLPISYPEWTPEQLPTVRSNGSFAVRLDTIPAVSDPRFTILGPEAERRWELRTAEYEDATGNKGHYTCRNEKAWKLSATFFRDEKAIFSTNEMFTVEYFRLPASGKVLTLQSNNVLSGRSVALLHLAGAGAYTFSNKVLTASSPWFPGMSQQVSSSTQTQQRQRIETITLGFDKPFVLMSHNYLGKDHEVTLRLRNGEKIVALGRGASGTGGWWYYSLTTHGPDQSWLTNNNLSLDIIVQRGKTVQFLVPPPTPDSSVLPLRDSEFEGDE